MSKFNARSQIILGIFVYIFILHFPLNPVHVRAELNIGSDILESIAGILEKPLQVYDLDLKVSRE